MTGKIFSPGKLLLTSEYTVLDGALALAVPTKWGQELFFGEHQDGRGIVFWEAYHQDRLWLRTEIDYKKWKIVEANHQQPAEFVLKVLRHVQQLSTTKLQNADSYHLKTNLQFSPDFGLGSSSTLMNNLAEWAAIDAFELNEQSLGGSGYDIAVAREKSAVLYQKTESLPMVKPVSYNPDFKDELVLIHLNQKQDSREGINLYRSREKSLEIINHFSALTEKVMNCDNLNAFSEIIEAHEQILSNFLLIKTVKEKHFADCPVFVKSLGAWGGDFILTQKFDGYKDYFSARGFGRIFSWNDIVV